MEESLWAIILILFNNKKNRFCLKSLWSNNKYLTLLKIILFLFIHNKWTIFIRIIKYLMWIFFFNHSKNQRSFSFYIITLFWMVLYLLMSIGKKIYHSIWICFILFLGFRQKNLVNFVIESLNEGATDCFTISLDPYHVRSLWIFLDEIHFPSLLAKIKIRLHVVLLKMHTHT